MPSSTALSSIQDGGFKWAVWASLLIFTLLLALFARTNSYFFADDYDHFIQAAQLPLLQMIFSPIDVHYAPLHKLFSTLIQYLAPLDFDLAVLVLLSFHALSVVFLYKLLQALSDTRLNLLIVFLYGCNPFLLHPLIWWSSGIHRFPYICLTLASLCAYVHYRQSRRPLQLASCYLAFLLAFGFYSKAILIPLYILGLELCLSYRDGLQRWFARFAPGGLMLLVSMGYVLWYLNFASVAQQGSNTSLAVAIEIILLNFKVMVGVLTFQEYAAANAVFDFLLSLLLVGGIYSLVKNRQLLVIGLMLLACLGVNFAMLAISSRGQAIGVDLAFQMRYYLEVMFLIAIFGSLMFATMRGRSRFVAVTPPTRHWMAFLACVVYLSALTWVGRQHYLVSYEKTYVATAQYMQQLIEDLDKFPADRPLLLAEASFPGYIYGDFINTLMPMEKLLPLRYHQLVTVPWSQAEYQVDEKGAVVSVSSSSRELLPYPVLMPGGSIDHTDNTALMGWCAAELEHRWSCGKSEVVMFKVQETQSYTGRLKLEFGSLSKQAISVSLNDELLGEYQLDSWHGEVIFNFNPALLVHKRTNVLAFKFPDAHPPGGDDERVLALALRRLTIY